MSNVGIPPACMPFLWFPLMLSMTDVWEAWQCPSHTLEIEMRRYSAQSRGTKQECIRRPHPAVLFQVSNREKMDKRSHLLLVLRKRFVEIKKFCY